MAKKQTATKIEVYEYDDLHRGTSYTIPIIMNKVDGSPFDLSEYTAIFTLKPAQSDFDYDDDRALITKEFKWDGDPEHINRIDIVLTSKELWLEPGLYYFDVVLMYGSSSRRILLASTNIVGGPTNHNVRHDPNQGDLSIQDPLVITEDKKMLIVGQVPLLTDPPKNVLETADADPKYIFEPLNDPVRDFRYRVYAPRLSLMMTFKVGYDATPHNVHFERFFLRNNIPAPCPLKGGYFTINNHQLDLHLAKEMDMMWKNTVVHYGNNQSYNGHFGVQKSTEPLYLGDNVASGHLYMHLNADNDQISIDAHYYIPDEDDAQELWMVRVDWFNWVDPYEPDPEKPDVGTEFPDGCPVADSWPGFWPPDMWYCADDTIYAKNKGKNKKCPGSIL